MVLTTFVLQKRAELHLRTKVELVHILGHQRQEWTILLCTTASSRRGSTYMYIGLIRRPSRPSICGLPYPCEGLETRNENIVTKQAMLMRIRYIHW